ncbi:unnamed protein product [Chrysodeixis includens]|uniref:trypsin n=1 Tax=Chrysodeixis includens TaxID=689277 RepID=A0A9N8Q2Z0_CHRIL|nr:unnamed protein product [Chrysodeixis includens]
MLWCFGILGGYDIKIRNAPYQVNYGDVCGGALIHKKWALTSAHCGSDHDFIRIGSSYRLRGPKVMILSHTLHPKFGHQHKFDYDVQLLKLFRGLYLSKLVSPITISRGECGDNIYVSGWGYPKEKGEYQETLQQAKMELVSMEECQQVEQSWYNHTLTTRMFCAGGWSQDACQMLEAIDDDD